MWYLWRPYVVFRSRVPAHPGEPGLPAALPAVRATAGFVEGFCYALWAFGTWWIPLLIVLGLWRHVRHHWPLTGPG